jgi:hypothetical protein
MTNAAVSPYSHPDYPAKAIVKINVGNVGIAGHTASSFNIYPNPTNNSFFIDCENFSVIKLFDMLGQELLTQTVNGKTEININHLPQGVYNVRIFSEGKVVGNSKIMKY